MWRHELLKNKIYATMIVLLGVVSIFIEYDATFFVFALIMGMVLFFSKENWIDDSIQLGGRDG